jgi:hypothetical protein
MHDSTMLVACIARRTRGPLREREWGRKKRGPTRERITRRTLRQEHLNNHYDTIIIINVYTVAIYQKYEDHNNPRHH